MGFLQDSDLGLEDGGEGRGRSPKSIVIIEVSEPGWAAVNRAATEEALYTRLASAITDTEQVPPHAWRNGSVRTHGRPTDNSHRVLATARLASLPATSPRHEKGVHGTCPFATSGCGRRPIADKEQPHVSLHQHLWRRLGYLRKHINTESTACNTEVLHTFQPPTPEPSQRPGPARPSVA